MGPWARHSRFFQRAVLAWGAGYDPFPAIASSSLADGHVYPSHFPHSIRYCPSNWKTE